MYLELQSWSMAAVQSPGSTLHFRCTFPGGEPDWLTLDGMLCPGSTSPAEAAGFLQGSRDSGGSSKDSSCDTDDFVMVPAQFPGKGPPTGWAGGSLQMCQIHP